MKPHEPAETPEETLDLAARHLREALEADVLDRVREAPPSFLEQVIVDLLIAMGYGGGDTARGRVTGRSGDGGSTARSGKTLSASTRSVPRKVWLLTTVSMPAQRRELLLNRRAGAGRGLDGD